LLTNRRLPFARILILAMVLIAAHAGRAWAVTPTPEEMDAAKRFATEKLASADPASIPFSFVYGGKPSGELLKTWQRSQKTESVDPGEKGDSPHLCEAPSGPSRQMGTVPFFPGTKRTITYADPQTGLQVRCEAIEYRDFPTVEWTLYFRNTGAADTPILENVQALDTTWQRPGDQEFLLHHAAGSQANRSDYGPRETPLPPKATKRLAGACGRPTNVD